MILSTHTSSSLSDACWVQVNTQSGQEAGCSFLRWNISEILQSSFQLKKKYNYLSSHYKTSPPKECLSAPVPMCPSCHAHVLPGFPSPLWVPEWRRSTLSLLSVTVQEGARMYPAFLWEPCATWWGLTHSLHASLMLWFCLKSPLPPVNASMTQPGRSGSYSSCWPSQWCPKQVTADTGEETAYRILNLALSLGQKQPLSNLFLR